MAITIYEKLQSPDGWASGNSENGGNLIYVITNDNNGTTAITKDEALAALVAGTAANLACGEITVYRLGSTVSPVCPSIWLGSVKYGAYQRPDAETTQYTFDTGGGTQHITKSISTEDSDYSLVLGETNFNNSINVDIDWKQLAENNADIAASKTVSKSPYTVNGLDMTVPVFNFSRTRWVDNTDVTPEYKDRLMRLTGCTNNASFEGHAAGEVLFLGASGSMTKRGAFIGKWEIQEKFAASPNRTGVVIGELMVDKKGWEYLWAVDGINIMTGAPITAQVNVEKIYNSGDFDDLEP
jgi:hypothetical protein